MVENGCLKMPRERKTTSQSIRKTEEMLGRRQVQKLPTSQNKNTKRPLW